MLPLEWVNTQINHTYIIIISTTHIQCSEIRYGDCFEYLRKNVILTIIV